MDQQRDATGPIYHLPGDSVERDNIEIEIIHAFQLGEIDRVADINPN